MAFDFEDAKAALRCVGIGRINRQCRSALDAVPLKAV